MGASQSSPHADNLRTNNLSNAIDYISAYYILTTEFEELSKLYDKQYCDKLVGLTTDIVGAKYSDADLTKMVARIKSGDTLEDTPPHNVTTATPTTLPENAKFKCVIISKFYVKIAHVFAAIITTINPSTTYKNPDGTAAQKPFAAATGDRNTSNINICDKRIADLERIERKLDGSITGEPSTSSTSTSGPPTMCDLRNGAAALASEPGIKELHQLYLDKYNFETNSFSEMTDESKAQYKRDLGEFYKSFTGNTDVPSTITSFGDIKLRDYSQTSSCYDLAGSTVKKGRETDMAAQLTKYSDSVRRMIQTASSTQAKLLTVLDLLFIFVPDKDGAKNTIRVNPELTEAKLNRVVADTRQIIIGLYLGCEKDYAESLKIYESIVDMKILDTTRRQISNLEEDRRRLIRGNADAYYAQNPFIRRNRHNRPRPFIPGNRPNRPRPFIRRNRRNRPRPFIQGNPKMYF